MPLTRLSENETAAFRRLLKGAMAELGLGMKWLGDVVYAIGGPEALRDTQRSLFERRHVSARAATRAMTCVLTAARQRGMVLRTKPANDLVFWGFAVGGHAVFQPGESDDEGLTLAQLQRTVFAETNVSAIYYFKKAIATKLGLTVEDEHAERLQDNAALKAMLTARRRKPGYRV